MKFNNIFKILGLLFVAIFYSCEEDNLQPVGEWELTNPEITTPTENENIILTEEDANENLSIVWEAAVSSEGYAVTYEVLIDDTNDFSSPLLTITPSNNGISTFASVTYSALDEILAYAGYAANTDVDVSIAVVANSLSKTSQDVVNITVHRFENEIIPTTLFLSGEATEDNGNIENAIQLKRLNNAEGNASNVYEVYTHLESGKDFKFYSSNSLSSFQYGGSDGVLETFGNAIQVEESAEYRVKVDLDNNTYELLKIDYWSVVGSPINNGWGGDNPLTYQGSGVWEADMDFVETGGFVFRANGDWAYLLKLVQGTNNQLIMESDAESQGVTFEDIPNELIGNVHVTLDLSANGYSYTIELNESEELIAPDALYLFEDGVMIEQLNQNGNTFSVDKYVAMQAGVNYTLNSAADGTGDGFTLDGMLADTDNPDGDNVSGTLTLENGTDAFTLAQDRALRLSFNFDSASASWQYYNIKLFHWSDWDSRDEFLMTYQHPKTYTLTTDLTAGYEMKFISPWDLDMGSETPSETSGSLINGGGSNLNCISTSGTYTVTIELDETFQSGTYSFN